MKVTLHTTGVIALYIDIEADSLEECIKEAAHAGTRTLCHQCNQSEAGVWNTAEGLELSMESPLDAVLVDGEELSLAELEKANALWCTLV